VEAEFGIPLLDSTSAVVWKALKLLGADGRRVEGWGRLFSL
jgi:maleate isomerase